MGVDRFHRLVSVLVNDSEDAVTFALDSGGSGRFVQNCLLAKALSLPHHCDFSVFDGVSRVNFVVDDVLNLGLLFEVSVKVEASEFGIEFVELLLL